MDSFILIGWHTQGILIYSSEGLHWMLQGPWSTDQELYPWEVSKKEPLWSYFSPRKGCTLEAHVSFGSQDKLGELFEDITPPTPPGAQKTFSRWAVLMRILWKELILKGVNEDIFFLIKPASSLPFGLLLLISINSPSFPYDRNN